MTQIYKTSREPLTHKTLRSSERQDARRWLPDSDESRAAGRLANAAATLERALRIEPRNRACGRSWRACG